MEVLAPVSPATHVHASDLGNCAHGALNARLEETELRCEVIREIAGLAVMSARLQDQYDRQSGGLDRRAETPAV